MSDDAKRCFLCNEPVVDFCRHCGQEFCASHASRLNSKLCCNCVSDANTQVVVEPLVDDDGVTHTGRKVRLIGEGWPNSMEMIASLSDTELEAKLAEWKRLLAESVKTTEYFRIVVCAAEHDKDDRHKSKVRRLHARAEELRRRGTVRLNAKIGSAPGAKGTKDDTAKLAEQLGITREQAVALMKVASQIGSQ